MPTSKPRISIVIDDADLAVLDRYALASGTPRASMLGALVKATIPELERAAELIELANAAPRQVVQGVVDNLANATSDAMGYLEPFRTDFHHVMDKLQRELQLQTPARRPGRASGGVPPPPARSGAARKGRRGPGDPHLLTGGSK